MRLLALVLAAGALAAADVQNRLCFCGKPVDPRVEPVAVTMPDGSRRALGVCSVEDGAKLKAMLPAEAVKAVEAANRTKK